MSSLKCPSETRLTENSDQLNRFPEPPAPSRKLSRVKCRRSVNSCEKYGIRGTFRLPQRLTFIFIFHFHILVFFFFFFCCCGANQGPFARTSFIREFRHEIALLHLFSLQALTRTRAKYAYFSTPLTARPSFYPSFFFSSFPPFSLGAWGWLSGCYKCEQRRHGILRPFCHRLR